jgi:hypothetical protein
VSLLWCFGGLLAVKSVANVVNGRALFGSGNHATFDNFIFPQVWAASPIRDWMKRGTGEDYSLGWGGVGCYLSRGMNPEKESMR